MRSAGPLCVALALFWAAFIPPAASADSPKLPNLSVSSGSVSLSKSGQKLAGKFVVRNKGTASAAKSSASLLIRAGGRNRKAGAFSIPALDEGKRRSVTVASALPSKLPAGPAALRACVDAGRKIQESAEADNCRTVGTIEIAPPSSPTAAPSPGPAPPGPPGPPSSVPTNPIPFTAGTAEQVTASGSAPPYWLYVPRSYDLSHATPTKLLVWLHGCEGQSTGDIYIIDPESSGGSATQSWIGVAVGGREHECWVPNTDVPKVLATVADVKSHFNIDPRQVILGGYSSGGDLAYRTGFYNSSAFAGLLIENSSPFRDTGSTEAQSLAAATTKFHVVHLAHTDDVVYPIDDVKDEVKAMKDAGFPVTLVERPGGHADDTTDPDLVTYLLPHMNDGWLAP